MTHEPTGSVNAPQGDNSGADGDERETRQRIDTQLREAGWQASATILALVRSRRYWLVNSSEGVLRYFATS